MKKIITLAFLASLSFSAFAERTYTIDQEAVIAIDSNMMWGDNCEFQLNQAVSGHGYTPEEGAKISAESWHRSLSAVCQYLQANQVSGISF